MLSLLKLNFSNLLYGYDGRKDGVLKQLLDTNNINIIESIKSILSSSTKYSNDYANLPDEVIKDISEAIEQIESGQ